MENEWLETVSRFIFAGAFLIIAYQFHVSNKELKKANRLLEEMEDEKQ